MKVTAQRKRIGAELRRLREIAGLSGERVAQEFDWSQSKVSRIESGWPFTVKDVTGLLMFYGVSADLRAELLAATAQDTGESTWVLQAGGYPRRQETIADMESATKRIRHYQPVVIPGLLQTYDYARLVAKAVGASDPEAIAEARMRRQETLNAKSAPRYEAVVDARALLLRLGHLDVLRDQILGLVDRAGHKRVSLQVVPLGAEVSTFAVVGFNIYDFQHKDSPSVVWTESPTGDTYYSAPDDVNRYGEIFKKLQGLALSPMDSVEYLQSFALDIERYMGNA
ncbi:helix-turn-helix domain-containing protein [Plantactinospora sp. GCM10030261]|uniref:helix-turn-helix domain-containing protein n=1 Tax=Plantactinospora sp. GCM10030261 TaxID=3273420 RepID=UPI003622963A